MAESAPASNKSRRISLRRISGPGPRGEIWVVPVGDTRMGRGEQCLIVLQDSKVSRVHSLLSVGPNGMTVADAGSSNGTFVNGEEIDQNPRGLNAGDEVRVGDSVLTVVTED